MTDLEIAVQDAAGVRIALEGGATRVELCAALRTGGLTPSMGAVQLAVEAAGGRAGFVHVLVRSRGGGYVYSYEDVRTMCADITSLAGTGVGGVVVGALTADGRIDLDVLARFTAAAGDLPVTFHRALDATADPLVELVRLAGSGVSRVLTSGAAVCSIEGLATLAAMVLLAPDGVQIMAGGGVRLEDIPALAAAGVAAVHLSARVVVLDRHPAGPGGGAQELDATDPVLVAGARAALSAGDCTATGSSDP
ncbi:copper homeostasis protein CutC [Arthrobacter oryzae]|uniref:PF03932 family protein CutC n=1 Tax=Arthrobacter oryzae TaxID=409290 RepID=A0A3N0C6X5_9MICC|nr:copper homeostasis protein CutC [Arthrobacter oryzae]RNL58103.1 copper homeostasis protein CutC [Arthrobacter oryzae]